MRDDGDDLARAVLHDGVCGFDERAAGVGHVVDEDGGFAADVADEDHAGDFVGPGSLFVDEGEAEVEAVGNGGGSVSRVSVCAGRFMDGLIEMRAVSPSPIVDTRNRNEEEPTSLLPQRPD